MRTAASFVIAIAILPLTCASLAAQRADSTLLGSWSGQAAITVPWTVQRTLPVRLDIKADGRVTGSVGDAQLLDAWVTLDSPVARALRLARRYAVAGRLSGALLQTEGIQRDRVHISLDRAGQTLTGDLQTSGSYEGSPAELPLTAKGLVLQRVERAISRVPRRDASATDSGLIATRPSTPR